MKNKKLLIHTTMYIIMFGIMHRALAMDDAIVPAQETHFMIRNNFSIGNILLNPYDANLPEHEVAGFEINCCEDQSDRVTIKLKNNTNAPYQLHKQHLTEFEERFCDNPQVNALSFSIVPHPIFQLPNAYYIVTRKTFNEFTNDNSITNMRDALSDEETESSNSENAYETESSDLEDSLTSTTFTSDKTKLFIGSTSFLIAILAFLYHCYPQFFSSDSLSSLLQKFSFDNSAQ